MQAPASLGLTCLFVVFSVCRAQAPTCSAGVCVDSHAPSKVAAEAVEFVAEKLSGLSKKDQDWVLQNAGEAIVAGAAVELDEEADGHGVIFYMFVLVCLSLMVQVMRVLWAEHCRYGLQHIGDQAAFRQYLLYRFCFWYTWTPGSAAIVLCTLSLVVMISGGVLLRFVTGSSASEALYSCWIWIAAPDGGGSAETSGGRLVGALMSCAGMLIFALLMSVVSSEVEEMLNMFRSGSVPVIAGDHVVILGWSAIVPKLIEELCAAEKSRGGSTIAILSPLPKLEMDELIRDSGINRENSVVVVRSGDMASSGDLEKVATASARCVIVLSKPGLSREDADSRTLNVMLRLQEKQWPCRGTCVVQCQLVRNARLMKSLAPNAEVITVNDAVGELMVQCSKQSGLASIITELLGFEGDEFYLKTVNGIAGKSFAEVALSLPDVVVVGVVSGDGVTEVLPAFDRTLRESDELIMLAEDVSTLPESFPTLVSAASFKPGLVQRQLTPPALRPEMIIMFGWNDMAGAIAKELDMNVGPNSKLVIFAPEPAETRREFLEKAQRRRRFKFTNVTVEHIEGFLGARFQLEELPLEQADKIIILADCSNVSPAEADGDMMALVLQIRDILRDRHAKPNLVITPQVLGHTTVSVLHNLKVHDFINSNELAGRILASVCENPKMNSVISGILQSDCHICVSELSSYPMRKLTSNGDSHVSFEEVASAASSVGDIALGWSAVAGCNRSRWELNPKDRKRKRPWLPESRVVVLRRDTPEPLVVKRDVFAERKGA